MTMKKSCGTILILLGIFVFFPVCSSSLNNPDPVLAGNQTAVGITIEPIPVHCVNDSFNLTGTTGLPAGTALRVSVYRGSYNPGIQPQKNPWYITIPEETSVIADSSGRNYWIYNLNTTGSYPDEYIVYIEPYAGVNVQAYAIFTLNTTCSPENYPEGSITIHPIGDHSAGDVFDVTGTSALPSDEEYLVEVYSADHMLGPRGINQSGSAGVIHGTNGTTGEKTWRFTVDTSDYRQDQYIFIISSYHFNVQAQLPFNVSGRPSGSTPAKSQGPHPGTSAPVPVMIPLIAIIFMGSLRKIADR
jgi:hypothetical protein